MKIRLSLGHWKLTYFVIFVTLSTCGGTVVYLQSFYQQAECDIGSEMTLFCNVSDLAKSHIVWLKDGHTLTDDLSWNVTDQRTALVSTGVNAHDTGDYSCIIDPDNDILSGREITTRDLKTRELNTQLVVKTPPGKLENVTVHASTIIATVHWHVSDDGGYPISHFTLLYRHDLGNLTNDTNWQVPIPLHISPDATYRYEQEFIPQTWNGYPAVFLMRQVFVYHLRPGTGYMFRLWATNKLGAGDSTLIFATTTAPPEDPDVLQQMLRGGDMDDFSSMAWMIAVSMVMGTVLILSCLSCILIYKEGRNGFPQEDEGSMPHIITNPGFEIDLEDSILLEHADVNSNRETMVRNSNNSIVLPSRV